ncbi:MAG: transketolase [Anaeromyxobacter sp.]
MSRALSRRRADALRVLAMDAVEQANSGHPGAPLGMADLAEVLWTRFLRHDPADPAWPDRDRFVLSNGHASMLHYALLHLSGHDLTIDDLRRFRQLGSRTAGHPERGLAPGVETTTGPLGQGFANAVGMALAERLLAAEFNRPGHEVVDHRTWVLLGDGCLMEGVSHEAASLAGTLGLGKLTALWDDNGISIDGEVKGWFTDDTAARFEAYGWHVVRDVDGHDSEAVARALEAARAEPRRPTLVQCRTLIGMGAPTKAGSHGCHGAPLGKEEVARTREALGWKHGPFEIPSDLYEVWDARPRGAALRRDWLARMEAYRRAFPAEAAELERRQRGELPAGFAALAERTILGLAERPGPLSTRKASQLVLEALAPAVPELVGGSADLTGSNLTSWKGAAPVGREGGGRYVHYGVREFGMAALMNGLALHGGHVPFGGTFLVFSDYARNGLRMASLMRLRSVFVLTHDSIGLGEDGPTHQPVEHVASLRLVPGLDVWRPCDGAETAVAWRAALERADGPSCLVLSRQDLPPQRRDAGAREGMARGGYVLSPATAGPPRAVVIATGSEVALALAAQALLAGEGLPVSVVSMPSTTVFDRQDPAWRARVLPPGLPRVAVEAGSGDLWRKYVGMEGAVVSLDRFGESGPAPELFRHFGFTAENVARTVKEVQR